jgi:hypothetical protein
MAEEKLTPREKRALKRRESLARATERLGVGRGSNEPVINPLDYKMSLTLALNHYNCVYDSKDKRKWVMSYVGKNSAKDFEEIPDYMFKSVGALIRLKQREQCLEDKELDFIDKTIDELRRLNKMEKVSSAVKNPEKKEEAPKVVKEDKTFDITNSHLAEFCMMIDTFITDDVEPDFASYLKASGVSAAIAKQIPQFFQKNLDEINEALEGNDKQLVEGYAFLKKTKLKKLARVYASIQEACQQAAVSNKVARVRKVKEKPSTVVAKNVKFMPECPELGLKSAPPPTLVNSTEVWIFNTKYKKLQVYRAVNGEKMSVKGTTLTNYDVASSSAKTIRNPEQVKDLGQMTKRNFELAFKNLKTKESAVNGRINEDCIILKVW